MDYIEAYEQTLKEIQRFLDDLIRHRENRMRSLVHNIAWPLVTKVKVKGLIDELERHKNTLGVAFSAQNW